MTTHPTTCPYAPAGPGLHAHCREAILCDSIPCLSCRRGTEILNEQQRRMADQMARRVR
ncbi:hypothetical protein DFW101_3548 [Solidesulfovibrio carbinoliphilus subsp. oakridgensis]|uniref:Uncharacterized protein n=1 Tax=Solidesulfovibrio carbinoliphilus subsp. oakridgensis TaxID=694327 RepID=G7QC98_9BACT|nr:hypothetical protein [Solidesulfovibrio carbinoliphilus]EHJ49544.1 hypothetical protein DFW101_3548 [Solidesulfovibrio carbinoliphilus subsp. oakridgensis]